MGGGKDKHKPNPNQNPEEDGDGNRVNDHDPKENITTKESDKNSMVCN